MNIKTVVNYPIYNGTTFWHNYKSVFLAVLIQRK